jgi:hypothetical protein
VVWIAREGGNVLACPGVPHQFVGNQLMAEIGHRSLYAVAE